MARSKSLDPSPRFGVAVSFASDRTVVAVRGELDLLTASAFGGFLQAAAGRGAYLLVIDLAELSFIDTRGLAEVARAVTAVHSKGGAISIVSASPLAYKVLKLCGLTEVASVEMPVTPAPATALSPTTVAIETAGELSVAELAEVLPKAELDEVLAQALRAVVMLAEATVESADGASVSLAVGELLRTVAASNDVIAGMDADQYALGEGPCVSASTLGQGFHIESMSSETRWPLFVPLAAERGIGAVISTPLTVEGRPVGALNIYSATPGAFAPSEGRIASVLAHQASAVLSSQVQKDVVAKVLASKLAGALAVRQSVILAQGILMERDGLSAESAHAVLRRASRASCTGLAGHASQIVDSLEHALAGRPQSGLAR